jgi:crossover junction endodeoxyribonuclease RusA
MIFHLPYPPSDLMPNRKNGKHWGATKDVKEQAIKDAYYITLEALKTRNLDLSDTYPLTMTFIQSDKRKRDLDNLLAASKASLDGVAKALKIDDKLFEPITIKRGYDTNSYVKVEIG